MDFVQDDTPGPEQQAEAAEGSADIDSLLEMLEERDQKIIRMRFGLPPYTKAHTLDEIGKAVKLTRERVRQRIENAKEDMRAVDFFSELRSEEEQVEFDYDAFKTIVEGNGFSPANIERKCGVGKVTAKAIIEGSKKPSPDTLKLLAEGLGVHQGQLTKSRGR
jgi:hypothetical protein